MMVESINNLNNNSAEIEKTNITFMRSENENPEMEMTSTPNMKMEGNDINGIFTSNNENVMGKEEQNLSSPVMYYNYNGFIPYPYIPMQTTSEGSFYQPVQAQVPPSANPSQTATSNAMFSSPVATSMIPMSRVPSNSSNAAPTNEMISNSGQNVLPTQTSNLPVSAVPPPMATMAAMPRIPYFPPQLSPSPLPMMPSNFNVAQPYSSPNHAFAPLLPTMNPGPGPMNGHRVHFNKNYHQYMSNNNTNYHFNDKYNKNNQTTNNLYIKGLKPEINDESLQDLCKQWGTIVSSKAIIDNKTNECKGYGFVMYETEDQAKLAMSELNKLNYQVSFAKESFSTRLKNLQDNVSTNIYMSNLPLDMNEEKFLELFQPFKVVSSIILYDQTGISRGVGLAKLENREEAQIIIDKYANKILPGGKNPLQVRFADSEAQKKLKGQTIHKKNYRNQEFHNQHQRNNMPYFNQYRGMNNYGLRNKIPFQPQMAYMAQPVWPVMSDAPMPLGINSPYMMNPVNPMNPQQPVQNNIMEPNNVEIQSQENINAIVTNQPINDNSINMNQNNTNNNSEINESNFKPVSPGKNINHQGINFPEILVNNAEKNCIASAVESNME